MLFVDIVLLAILVIAFFVGLRQGLLSSLGVLVGLIGGALLAFWAVPWAIPLLSEWIDESRWRSVAIIAGAVALAAVGGALGGAIGGAMRGGVDRTPLRIIDRLLGAGLSVVVTALSLVLVAQTVTLGAVPAFSAAVSSSRVLGVIDDLTPDPVDATLAQLRGAVLDEGLPRLGDLFGPGVVDAPGEPAPAVALDDPQLTAAARSVARISGVAYACGTSSTGSGFVIAPDRIVTNAHVVAGVDEVVVEFPGIPAREGRIVSFDPIEDLAVIAVDDLGVPALAVAPTLVTDDEAVVQGYPFGGPFTMVGARVLSVGSVSVPDIYDASASPREIYALSAAVRPGNSGGPLLTSAGEVAGVVFARAESGDDVGYAMTPAELLPVIAQAQTAQAVVSTGACTG